MTVETLKKAQTLQNRIKRAEDILNMLNAVENLETQKKDTTEEDFVTKLALCDESEMPRGYYHLTKDQIEIMKKAFEKYIHELDIQFCTL